MGNKENIISRFDSAKSSYNRWVTTMSGVGGVNQTWSSIPKTLEKFEYDKSQLDLVGQQRAIREAKAQMKLTRKQLGYVEWKMSGSMKNAITRSKNDSMKLLEDMISENKAETIRKKALNAITRINTSNTKQGESKIKIERWSHLVEQGQTRDLTSDEKEELEDLTEEVKQAAGETTASMSQALSSLQQSESMIKTMICYIYLPTGCLSVNDTIIDVPTILNLKRTQIPYMYELNIESGVFGSGDSSYTCNKIIIVITKDTSTGGGIYKCKLLFNPLKLEEEKLEADFVTAFTIALVSDTTITQVAHGGVFFKWTGDGGGGEAVEDNGVFAIKNGVMTNCKWRMGGLNGKLNDTQLPIQTGLISLKLAVSYSTGTSYARPTPEITTEYATYDDAMAAQQASLDYFIVPIYYVTSGVITEDYRNIISFDALEYFASVMTSQQ